MLEIELSFRQVILGRQTLSSGIISSGYLVAKGMEALSPSDLPDPDKHKIVLAVRNDERPPIKQFH